MIRLLRVFTLLRLERKFKSFARVGQVLTSSGAELVATLFLASERGDGVPSAVLLRSGVGCVNVLTVASILIRVQLRGPRAYDYLIRAHVPHREPLELAGARECRRGHWMIRRPARPCVPGSRAVGKDYTNLTRNAVKLAARQFLSWLHSWCAAVARTCQLRHRTQSGTCSDDGIVSFSLGAFPGSGS